MPASRSLITAPFRMSYPNLLVPTQYDGKGEFTYNMQMIYEPEDLGKFRAPNDSTGEFDVVDAVQVVKDIAKAEWGVEAGPELVPSPENLTIKWPIKRGTLEGQRINAARAAAQKAPIDTAHIEGKALIGCKAYTKYAPKLWFMDGQNRVQAVRGDDVSEQKAGQFFYGGAYGYAALTAKATISGGNRFVTFYVNDVRFLKHGERLGGGSMLDRFEGIHGGMSDYDATEGMDDEIPF